MNIIDLVVWQQIKKERESQWEPEPLYDYAPESPITETDNEYANVIDF